jgi:hypothetical protein
LWLLERKNFQLLEIKVTHSELDGKEHEKYLKGHRCAFIHTLAGMT